MELPRKRVNSNISITHNNKNSEAEKMIERDVGADNRIIVEIEEKHYETIVLGDGKTLRILSLEIFGDKAFWVYIYQENIDVISNPNKVNYGLELKIPDINEYFIDNNDPESIYKAKLEGFRVLEEEQKI